MLPLERQNKLMEFLKLNSASTVSDLASLLQVHEATIRRDLIKLDNKNLITRTYGGALIEKGVHSEPPFQKRMSIQYEEKRRIGNRAAELIENGDNIILDSGTTTLHIANAIRDRKNLTVITNDINIAAILRFSNSIKVIVTGGTLFPESYVLNGLITDETLNSINIQKSFIGTPAIHHEKGLTHFDEAFVSAKKGMVRAAKEIIVVADHTKISRVSTHFVTNINRVDYLVTGQEIEEANFKKLQDVGVQLYFA